VWGISYAGAFEELERLGILQPNPVRGGHFGRVDAGLLLALGYNSTEISRKIRGANYASFWIAATSIKL